MLLIGQVEAQRSEGQKQLSGAAALCSDCEVTVRPRRRPGSRRILTQGKHARILEVTQYQQQQPEPSASMQHKAVSCKLAGIEVGCPGAWSMSSSDVSTSVQQESVRHCGFIAQVRQPGQVQELAV